MKKGSANWLSIIAIFLCAINMCKNISYDNSSGVTFWAILFVINFACLLWNNTNDY